MSALRILAIYRASFVALLVLASGEAVLAAHQSGSHIVPLAAAEIAGALALLSRRSRLAGACVLLAVFALAQVLSGLDGHWPTHFLQYAASTLLILALGRALTEAPSA